MTPDDLINQPEIREAFEKYGIKAEAYYKLKDKCFDKWAATQNGRLHQDETIGWLEGYDAAYFQQAAELKQLRAERAGLLELLNDLVYLDKCHPAELANDPEYLANLIVTIAARAKSKLTDSAQITTDTEGENT